MNIVGINREKNGWRVDWRNEYGQRERRTFDSKTAADHFLIQEKAKVQGAKNKILPMRIRFKELADSWLKKVKKDCEERNKPRTYEWYEMIVRVHLNPLLGDYDLSDLSPSFLRGSPNKSGIKEKLFSKNLSSKSVRNYLTCLGTILNDAYKQELIEKELSTFLDLPKVISRTDNKRPLTQEEVASFFEICPQQYHLFYALSFFTGMRTGEVLALRFGDIDLRNQKIHAERTLDKNSGHITSTKTGEPRLIDITPHLQPFFTDWRHIKDIKGDLIFPGYHEQNLRNRVWMPILRKMKIAHRKPYVTRHTFASIMLSEGQPAAWVANMMGDNLQTVLRCYAQWIPTEYKKDLMRPIRSDLGGHFLDTLKHDEWSFIKNVLNSGTYILRDMDSNHDSVGQSHVSCRWTIPHLNSGRDTALSLKPSSDSHCLIVRSAQEKGRSPFS